MESGDADTMRHVVLELPPVHAHNAPSAAAAAPAAASAAAASPSPGAGAGERPLSKRAMSLGEELRLAKEAQQRAAEGGGEGRGAARRAVCWRAGRLLEVAQALDQRGQYPLRGTALWCLPTDNCFRRAVHALVTHWAFNLVIMLLILADVLLNATVPPRETEADGLVGDPVEVAELTISGVFLVEVLLRCVALGAVLGEHAFLRADHWNKLDFALVAVTVAAAVPGSVLPRRVTALRGVRALRIMRSIRLFTGIRAILDSLAYAMAQLKNVSVIMGFFLLMFAIMGVEAFFSSFSRRCVVSPAVMQLPFWGLGGNGTAPLPYVASLPPRYCEREPFMLRWLGGNQCPAGQACVVYGNELRSVNFDNVLHALLALLQLVTLDGYTAYSMYPAMESEYRVAFVYFVVGVLLLKMLVVNIFVAVVTTSFGAVREQLNRMSAFTRNQAPLSALPSGLRRKQSRGQVRPQAPPSLRRALTRALANTRSRCASAADATGGPADGCPAAPAVAAAGTPGGPGTPGTPGTDAALLPDAAAKERHAWLRAFVLGQRFQAVVLGAILLNTVMLAMVHHNMSGASPVRPRLRARLRARLRVCSHACPRFACSPPFAASLASALRYAEIGFSLFFLLEALLKIVALRGVRNYLRDPLNAFDATVVVVSVLSLTLELTATASSSLNFSAFRALRLLRVLSNVRLLRDLLRAVVGSVSAVLNLLVFMALFLILIAILGPSCAPPPRARRRRRRH